MVCWCGNGKKSKKWWGIYLLLKQIFLCPVIENYFKYLTYDKRGVF